MERYNPTKIEEKWQKIWETEQAFRAEENGAEKMYLAEMFPYPSGAGLHVGHVRNFSIVDVLARFYVQNGKNVLRPFGYDTFGLPAENYAIKTGISPAEATKTTKAAEVSTEDIPEVTENIFHRAITSATASFEGCVSELVVLCSFLFVAQYFIGLSCLFEFIGVIF